MDLNRDKDRDQDKQSRPTIQPPGQQPDQQQIPGAPPQGQGRPSPSQSSQWIPPTTGNPDLDPVNLNQGRRIDLRERNPLSPQGMLFDPRSLIDGQRQPDPSGRLPPPGARFDPFGPPDPSQVGPGRGPVPSSQFGVPDPDHLPPPGMPHQANKSLKNPFSRMGGGPGSGPGGFGGGGPFM